MARNAVVQNIRGANWKVYATAKHKLDSFCSAEQAGKLVQSCRLSKCCAAGKQSFPTKRSFSFMMVRRGALFFLTNITADPLRVQQ
jgi:hypothetical protein